MTEDGIRATNIRVVRAEPTFPSGNASFASHLRPSIICSAAMACWASPGVANVTNPNPLDFLSSCCLEHFYMLPKLSKIKKIVI